MCLFGVGREKENLENTVMNGVDKRYREEDEWRIVGDKRIKVVGVILLLEPI